MADPVSPALTASNAASTSIPAASLNASTPSIATGIPAATATSVKKGPPKQGDSFESSLGYGGKDTELLASVSDVGGDDPPAAARLMKNLLFAPTHKSYEKMTQTKGHAPTAAELKCTAYLLPAICRDSTKFSRPVVPLMRVFEDKSVQLTYVVYGNDAAPGKETYIMYNLDEVHGVALSTNVRQYVGKLGGWCKRNLMDHQVKYILGMLSKLESSNFKIAPTPLHMSWKEMYNTMLSAKKLSIGLLVVDGLGEEDRTALRGAYMQSLLPEDLSTKSAAYAALSWLELYGDECNNTYMYKEHLYPLFDMALLKTKDRLPKPAPAPAPVASKKRPQAVDDSDDSDSDAPLAPPPKRAKPAEKPAEKPVEKPVEKAPKKKDEEDSEEEQMSGSGSDSGSNSDSEEEEESEEEEDSDDEEEEDDSDDDEPKKKASKSAPKPVAVATTPGGTAKSPAPAESLRPQIRQNGESGKSSQKAEKEKRKPAKSRRQSMEKTINGILRQGKGLDDAVPTQNQDKLSARMAEVEKTLRPFVEEGKVVHVHELLHTSWGLVSELFTIVNAIGRAGGPAPPDSAVSRRLALTMGRLFDNESKDIEDLSKDLAGWASKMASIVATRAQVALQGDQDARQLIPQGSSSSEHARV